MIKGGFGWEIGNGEEVSTWFDTWIENEPLCISTQLNQCGMLLISEQMMEVGILDV